MKIMTLAKLAALGGAAYYVKKQGGFQQAFDKLKESMKSVADQAKPAFEKATGASMGSSTSGYGSSVGSSVGTDVGSDVGGIGSTRSGSTFGNKTNY